MGYSRSMYLLSLLYGSSDEDRRKKLLKTFGRIAPLSEEYQQLSKLLASVTFFGHDGIDKRQESHDALAASTSQIQNAAQNIDHMAQLVGDIEREIQKTAKMLNSPAFFDDDLLIVPTKDIELYGNFYRQLANAICYYLASQFGVEKICGLSFNYRAPFQDLVSLVNKQYAYELEMSAEEKKPTAWAISKVAYGGANLIQHEGYQITYSNQTLDDMLKKADVGEYIRIAPYIFAVTNPDVEVQYIGIGNAIGVSVEETLSLLDAEIVTELPAGILGASDIVPANILAEVQKGLGSECYCVTPEELVKVLNSWSLSRTVADRRKNQKCIICGKTIESGSIVCSEHFSIKA